MLPSISPGTVRTGRTIPGCVSATLGYGHVGQDAGTLQVDRRVTGMRRRLAGRYARHDRLVQHLSEVNHGDIRWSLDVSHGMRIVPLAPGNAVRRVGESAFDVIREGWSAAPRGRRKLNRAKSVSTKLAGGDRDVGGPRHRDTTSTGAERGKFREIHAL